MLLLQLLPAKIYAPHACHPATTPHANDADVGHAAATAPLCTGRQESAHHPPNTCSKATG
eukprot:2955623-Prorocentrum_lima.AAC.1